MDYLAGHLSAEESHEIEKLMAENEFVNDAMEGLSGLSNKKNLESLVEQLNTDLHKKLEEKKNRKKKRRVKEYSWVYLALILIIVLVVVAVFMILRLQQFR